jgi:hypothetical protein
MATRAKAGKGGTRRRVVVKKKIELPPFEPSEQYLTTDSPVANYYEEKNKSMTVEWGQRKLILSAIQFFVNYWDPEKYPEPQCVYIGAAPGISVNVMYDLFPGVRFHLYDDQRFNAALPQEENVNERDQRIFLYPRYFTSDDVEKWKKEKGVFLISDIRSIEHLSDKKKTTHVAKGNEKISKYDIEKIVIRDMLTQQEWLLGINPVQAQLKFRLPYVGGYEKGDQFIRGYYQKGDKAVFPYLQGSVFLQSWVSAKSTETRLVPTRDEDGEYHLVDWDSKKYEDMLFHHNVKVRENVKYQNPFTGDDMPVEGLELTNDWNSMCEVQILSDYLRKVGMDVTQENIVKLSKYITFKLNEPHAGAPNYKEVTLGSKRDIVSLANS